MNRASRWYEVGDEVTLTVRVIDDVSPTGAYVEVVGAEDAPGRSYITPGGLDAGTLMPRPIQVGDRVTWCSDSEDYEVLVIREGDACLADARTRGFYGVPRGGLLVAPVSSLVKVSP